MRILLPLLAGAVILALCRPAAAASLFDEPDRIAEAVARIREAIGGPVRALSVTIDAAAVTIRAQDPRDRRHVDEWRLAQRHLGFFQWDRLSGPTPVVLDLVNPDIEANLFDLDEVDFAAAATLARAAIERAALEDKAQVTGMTIERQVAILPTPSSGAVRWTVEVGSGRESAEIVADARGRIVGARLAGTNRAKTLDLHGQPGLAADAAAAFRAAVGADPVLLKVDIGASSIGFETTLPDKSFPIPLSGSIQAHIAYSWSLDGLRRTLGNVNVDAAFGPPPYAPFGVDEADWTVLPTLMATARQSLGMAKGRVSDIGLSKPTEGVGTPVLLWRVEVTDDDGEKGTVLADMKGAVAEVLLPPSRRGPTDWRDPAAMVAAFARIEREFGAGATLAELLFYDDKVTITARDPRQPTGFTQVLLRDDGFARFGTPSPFSTANAPFAITDLRPLTAKRLTELEAAALARLKLPAKSITTITIGRGGMDPSPKGNVAIEIRAETRPGGRSGRVEYELDGTVIVEYLPDDESAGAAPTANPDDYAGCGQQRDADRSIAACTRILQKPGLGPRDQAVSYTNRGLAYAAKGDFDRAIADQGEAIRSDPGYENAWNNRGLAWYGKGDLDHAIADYGAALDLEPGSALVLRNRARAWLDKGDFDRAIADYDASFHSEPDIDYARYNRGLANYRKGDLDGAIADFGETIRINPNYAAAYGVRGRIHYGRGEDDRAMADYDSAIRLAPQTAIFYLDRGVALLYSGSLARAESDLKQANELDPRNAYYVLWLDIVEQRNGLPSRLPAIGASVDAKAWPAPVLRFFLGDISAADLVAAAADPDPTRNRGQVCEASFYAGEMAVLQGRKEDAVRPLEAAAAGCPHSFIEWDGARAELSALGVKP